MFGKHASETRRLTSGQVTQDGSVVATEVGGRKVLCSKSALSEGSHVHCEVCCYVHPGGYYRACVQLCIVTAASRTSAFFWNLHPVGQSIIGNYGRFQAVTGRVISLLHYAFLRVVYVFL